MQGQMRRLMPDYGSTLSPVQSLASVVGGVFNLINVLSREFGWQMGLWLNTGICFPRHEHWNMFPKALTRDTLD